MNTESSAQKFARVPGGFWAILALVAWALAVTALIGHGPYGLDEATARAVLFLWSISDQVASPIVTLGIPDFRAVYLIPAGVPFSGSLLASKLCTLLVVVAGTVGLYLRRVRSGDGESALLASGLLLLSPLAVASIDRILIGPFLLLTFLLGAWADEGYRESRVRFGGFYFGQLLLCVAAATLHPAGLAYPLVLALSWRRAAPQEASAAALIPGRERTHVLLGIGIATIAGVLLAGGWRQQIWFANPITGLAADIFAFHPESTAGDALAWALGAGMALGALACLWLARAQLRSDRLALTLAAAAAIAAFAGDASYSLLVLVLLLYWGFALLLRVRTAGGGFLAQRGAAFAVLLVVSTAFLSADRARYERIRDETELSEQDQLIRTLAATIQQSHPVTEHPGLLTEEEKARSGPRVASEWPGRTMIACRCSTLPLPPGTSDEAAFLANLRGIDYVVFDPQNPLLRGLSQNFALLGGAQAETVSLQAGGVVLRIHSGKSSGPAPEPSPQSTPQSAPDRAAHDADRG